MLRILDRVEEKYFASDATVAPGGWCCWCWCCNGSVEVENVEFESY